MYACYLDELRQYLPKKDESFCFDENIDLEGLQFLINRIPCPTKTEAGLLDLLYQVCEAYQDEHEQLRKETYKIFCEEHSV